MFRRSYRIFSTAGSKFIQAASEFKEEMNRAVDKMTDSVVIPLDGSAYVESWGKEVSGESLWTTAKLTRQQKTFRELVGNCVVGGSGTIRKLWHGYGQKPKVIFAPDNAPVPDWCLNPASPTVIVQCPPVEVNKKLLSSEYTDGFAAEFAKPMQPPLSLLLDNDSTQTYSRLLVVDGVRVPSNLGALLRGAKKCGFDGVISLHSSDFFGEKVIRASSGVVFDQSLPLFDLTDVSQSPTHLIQEIAAKHRLMPFLTVPTGNDTESLFASAEKFHLGNIARKQRGEKPIGSMVILGSESAGLQSMLESWGDFPCSLVKLTMDNYVVSSLNVKVAGNVAMQHFRKGAENAFQENFARDIRPVEALDGSEGGGAEVDELSNEDSERIEH